MEHFKEIYAYQAQEYHRMIEKEDVDCNLLPALEKVILLRGKRVLDLGTGTGRIPLLLANQGTRVVGLDLNRPMLCEQAIQRARIGGQWPLVEGDMRFLPFGTGRVDIVVDGWAVGHLRSWFDSDWKTQISLILNEMHRVTAPGGALVVLETLSTGRFNPAPPNKGLAELYAWLEEYWGFTKETIQTDYQFSSVDEAVELTEFFFGSDLAADIRRNGWSRLPEWTGVWSKRV